MGSFEEKTATATRKALPEDVPDAKTAAGNHPDGAVYRANDGSRYVLRHARTIPAKWAPVRTRTKAKDNGSKKK